MVRCAPDAPARAETPRAEEPDRPWAASAFAGVLSTDPWEDVLTDPGGVDFEESRLFGLYAEDGGSNSVVIGLRRQF